MMHDRAQRCNDRAQSRYGRVRVARHARADAAVEERLLRAAVRDGLLRAAAGGATARELSK